MKVEIVNEKCESFRGTFTSKKLKFEIFINVVRFLYFYCKEFSDVFMTSYKNSQNKNRFKFQF
jgi:hypothetical protein